MLRLLGQMMKLPIAAFVYGMEMLVKVVRDFQRTADHSVDVMVGEIAHGVPQGDHVIDAEDASARALGETASGGTGAQATGASLEEGRQMADSRHDLSDDDLKLVRYKILFVKRDYEHAFPEREELVSDNMTGTAFTGWKIAEFIQRLGQTDVPEKWIGKKYPRDFGTQKSPKIEWLKEDDKKYLRVFYEVLDRYPREVFKYEEDQVAVLREIRDELREKRTAGGGGRAGGGAGTGSAAAGGSASGGGAPSGGASGGGAAADGGGAAGGGGGRAGGGLGTGG